METEDKTLTDLVIQAVREYFHDNVFRILTDDDNLFGYEMAAQGIGLRFAELADES